jgi:hypothetical protein
MPQGIIRSYTPITSIAATIVLGDQQVIESVRRLAYPCPGGKGRRHTLSKVNNLD